MEKDLRRIKVLEENITVNNKTFLVFNTACFGDVLLCNSLCQNIKKLYPDSKVVFIVDKPFYEAAKYQKDVDDVVIYDKKGIHKGIFGLIKFLKSFKYKNSYASFVTYRNMRNMLISRLSGAKHIIQASKVDEQISTQEKHTNLLKRITSSPIENLPIRFIAEKNIPEKFSNKIVSGKKYIALCTVSKKLAKDMPVETAVEIINKINSETNCEVIFTGAGQKAVSYAELLKNKGCKFIDLTNKTTILELASILRNCTYVISVDTGTMHMGCALDLPVTAVFYEAETMTYWAPNPKLYNSVLICDHQTSSTVLKSLKRIKNTGEENVFQRKSFEEECLCV